MGKSSINGPFSMAMLNNQRVYMYIIYIYVYPHYIPIWSQRKINAAYAAPAFPSGHWTGPTSEHHGHHAKEPILGTSKSSKFLLKVGFETHVGLEIHEWKIYLYTIDLSYYSYKPTFLSRLPHLVQPNGCVWKQGIPPKFSPKMIMSIGHIW